MTCVAEHHGHVRWLCGNRATLPRIPALTTHSPFTRRTLSLAVVFFLVSCFGESTGPELRRARLAILPSFANPEAARVVDFDRVRVTLRRPGQTPPALHFDTVITFPAGADTLRIELTVPIDGTSEPFNLYLAMYNTALGDTVFTSGPDLITATTNVLNIEDATPVLDYVGVGANAAGVRFVNPPPAAFFGATVNLVAEAFDSGGVAIPGTPIQFVLATPADSVRARIPDRDVGQVIAGQQRGNAGIRAELLTGPFTVHPLAVQPVANGIQVQSGNTQQAPAGTALAQPLVARVLAADALGVQGVVVTFAVVTGSGTLSALVDTTDVAGDVTTQWTLGPAAGAQSVTATAVGVTGIATFTATATVTAPVALAFQVQPSNTGSLGIITPAVEVRLVTATGATATTATNAVTIAIAANPAGGTLGGTLTVNAVAGIATFADLTIDNIGIGYTLQATATGLTPATSTAFDVAVAGSINRWINLGGGTWSTPADWSRGTVPGPSDTVEITQCGSYTVALDVDVTVERLIVGCPAGGTQQTLRINSRTLTITTRAIVGTRGILLHDNGTVTGAGGVDVAGRYDFQVGTWSTGGVSQVAGGGLLDITNAGGKAIAGGTLDVAGTLRISGTLTVVQANNGAVIRALSGGAVDLQGDNSFIWNSGAAPLLAIQAGASLTRGGGTGTFTLSVPVQNDGTLAVMSGTLDLSPFGQPTTSGGAFTVATGTLLRFANAAATLGSTSTVTGAGEVHVTGGTATLAGGYAVTGPLRVLGGNVVFNNPAPVSVGVLELSSGSLGGSGQLDVTTSMDWSGGTLQTGGGLLRIASGATLAMAGTASRFLTGYNLEVAGAATYSATAGFFQLNSGAQLRVVSGGSFDVQGDRTIQWGSGGVPLIHVQSGGTFTRSTGTGVFSLTAPLQNDGVATFGTGTTDYAPFGQALTGSGQFNVPAGAILDFAGVNLTLSAASSISGAGEVHFSSNTVVTSGAYAVTGTTRIQGGTFACDNAAGCTTTNLVLSSGTRAGTGLLQVTGGMTWTAGTLAGPGTTRIPTGVTLGASGASVHDFNTRHVLEIGGTLNYAATGAFRGGDSAIVRILAGATLDFQTPGNLAWSFGSIPPRIENAGTLRYSGTGGTYGMDGVLDNTGTLQVQTDTVRLTRGSTLGGTLNLVGANAKVASEVRRDSPVLPA